MWEDEVIEEVRKARREIEAECGNDLKRIFELAKAEQERHADRVVPAPSRPPVEAGRGEHGRRA